jgi:TrmH family RNA methyltransferase
MLPVTSLQNPTIKLIRSLADKKGRRDHCLFAVEGHAMLEKALEKGWKPKHVLATRDMDSGVPNVLRVSPEIMAALSAQNNPHEVLATFAPVTEQVVRQDGVWLALEDIRDPGNLGTILRTSEAAGLTGIILAGQCCDPYSPESVRASTGSIFSFNPVTMTAEELAKLCHNWAGDSVGTAMTATEDFRRSYKRPTLIALGSESRGLSDGVRSACKRTVRIPMAQGVESLNVAIAAALMMYEVSK